MKLRTLEAIAHNLANSLADGSSGMIGMYGLDVWAEARATDAGALDIDFLHAAVENAPGSSQLRWALELFRKALPRLCTKHGASEDWFVKLQATYARRGVFIVTIQGIDGRASTRTYRANGACLLVQDSSGRLRRDRRRSAATHS